MLIYLIAGEPSGDTLGARLMKALKQHQGVTVKGIGGENMQNEGLKSLFDIKDLAVMGLAEVIPSIPKVLKRLNQTVADIKKQQPDAVITIDSWSFCSRVHKALKKAGINTCQIHYVAPQVWAWKKGRAKTMYKYIDRLLTLFPNEPAYFTPHKLKADFIGHPAIESPYLDASPDLFKEKYNLPKDKKIILILPGSRHNEVERLLPPFLKAAELLRKDMDNLCFVLPTVKTVESKVRQLVEASPLKDILIINTPQDRPLAARAAAAAMAASGTVSLELAIAGIPHLIAYKVSPLTAFIARRFLKIWSVNLPNIILNERIIPELLQEDCQPQKIARTLIPYIKGNDKLERKAFDAGIKKLKTLLGVGTLAPSMKAAEIILEEIASRKQK